MEPETNSSASSPLLLACGEGVATLAINRPEKGNALSAQLVELLLRGAINFCADPSIHTLVLRANGPHFCLGFDLSNLDGETDGVLLQRLVRIELLLDALWRAPVRTVALANGKAWGAGADLFAACDERLATREASFSFPGAAFGVVLGTRRLAERIGTDRARRCTCEGLVLDAGTARDYGLVSNLLENHVEEQIRTYCTAPVADRETVTSLRTASRARYEDADLAALVRSAARPGLKQRMESYRAQRFSMKSRPW